MSTPRIFAAAALVLANLAVVNLAGCDKPAPATQPGAESADNPEPEASTEPEAAEADAAEPAEPQTLRAASCPLALTFAPQADVTARQKAKAAGSVFEVEQGGQTFKIEVTCTAAPDLKLEDHIQQMVAGIRANKVGEVSDPISIEADGQSGWQFEVRKGGQLSRSHFFHYAGQQLVYLGVAGTEGVAPFTQHLLERLEWASPANE